MIVVVAVGNLGADPEKKSEQAPVKFRIACSDPFTKADGTKVENTTWLSVSVWGKLGEVCLAHLKKGRPVCVKGELRSSEYEKDGQKHTGYEVVAEKVKFLGGKPQEDAGSKEKEPEAGGETSGSDDIPF